MLEDVAVLVSHDEDVDGAALSAEALAEAERAVKARIGKKKSGKGALMLRRLSPALSLTKSRLRPRLDGVVASVRKGGRAALGLGSHLVRLGTPPAPSPVTSASGSAQTSISIPADEGINISIFIRNFV